MVISDRTKGCCSSDLNEPPHPNHDQFAELDAHNWVKGVGRPLDFAVFHPTTPIGHCSCQSLSPSGKGHADPIGLKRGEAVRPTGGTRIETAAFCHLKS